MWLPLDSPPTGTVAFTASVGELKLPSVAAIGVVVAPPSIRYSAAATFALP